MTGLMKGWLPAAILVMLSAMSVPQVEEPVVEQGSEWNIKIVDFVVAEVVVFAVWPVVLGV